MPPNGGGVKSSTFFVENEAEIFQFFKAISHGDRNRQQRPERDLSEQFLMTKFWPKTLRICSLRFRPHGTFLVRFPSDTIALCAAHERETKPLARTSINFRKEH
jgi:hypothetical protein